MSTLNPKDLLEQLKSSATIRTCRSLDIVYDVCKEQSERGSKVFSIALIGRLSKERGGPNAQSIRNRTGDAYKGVIDSWAKHTGGSLKQLPKQSENPFLALLKLIPDPAVRAVVGTVLAENKKLKGQLNVLKHNAVLVIDKRADSGVEGGSNAIQVLPALHNLLTDSERLALQESISERFIADMEWAIDPMGRIVVARNKRVVFKVGYVTAIRRVLDALGK